MQLESSKVRNAVTGEITTSEDRIAKSAYLENDENEHVKLVRRRVEHMTGLTLDTAERVQITYYGIGGFYLSHFDFVAVSTV